MKFSNSVLSSQVNRIQMLPNHDEPNSSHLQVAFLVARCWKGLQSLQALQRCLSQPKGCCLWFCYCAISKDRIYPDNVGGSQVHWFQLGFIQLNTLELYLESQKSKRSYAVPEETRLFLNTLTGTMNQAT